MSYCLLRQDVRAERWRPLHLEGIAAHMVTSGVPVAMPAEPVLVTLGAVGREPSDFLEYPFTVVSSPLRAILDTAGIDNVQYLPALLQREFSDDVLEDYWVANVIGLVSCVDPDRSQYRPGASSGALKQFEIDPLRARGFDLFRLAESPRLIVISARIVARLRAAQLRGLVLQETSTYTGAPASTATS